jgi:hypothetical protein
MIHLFIEINEKNLLDYLANLIRFTSRRHRVRKVKNVKKRTDEFQRKVVAIVWGKERKENVGGCLRWRTNGTMTPHHWGRG